MLAGLSLNFTSLVVALGNGCGEITVSRNHDQRHICLRGPSDHVLDEIAVARGINDGVVPLLCVELLGSASNGHTTLALLLLPVHVESKSEGPLAQTLSLSLQLLELTLWQTSELKDQAACGGALATVDMATNDNGEVLLLRIRRHCKYPSTATKMM